MRSILRIVKKWGDQRYIAHAWKWGQLELTDYDMVTLMALRGSEYHTLLALTEMT